MRAFDYASLFSNRSASALALRAALVIGVALFAIGGTAQADPSVLEAPAGPAALAALENGKLEVVAISGSPRIEPSTRQGSVQRGALYVGMTRTSARQKIENIDPKSWLAQFGDVEAIAAR